MTLSTQIAEDINFTHVWQQLLWSVMQWGNDVRPRGKLTREVPQLTITVDTQRPVLDIPERKLSYKFMAAEAYWILSGDNRVETIAPYNKNIAQFSDDGKTFFGAYGPKIAAQLQHVVKKLAEDEDTRQAGLTTWRESPPPTKDVPCTIAIWFQIRNKQLNCHVFMRSSDIWLGVPYDVFNFSMLTHLVCGQLNAAKPQYSPGKLYLTAASSHIYAEHFDAARLCVCAPSSKPLQPRTPKILWWNDTVLLNWLQDLRDTLPGHELRWWELGV